MYKGRVQRKLGKTCVIRAHENVIGSLVVVVILLVGICYATLYALADRVDSRYAYYCRTAVSTGNVEYLNEYCGGVK